MSAANIRSLVRETAVYGVSGVLARSMGLILLPVLSNFLPVEQYGHLGMTFLFIGFMQLLLVFGMGSSLVRYMIGAEDRRRVFSSHFWPLLAVSSLGSLLILLNAESIAGLYFSEHLAGDATMIRLAVAILFLDAMTILPYSLLRALNRPFTYLAGFAISSVIYAALTIYLLIFQGRDMTGVLTANAIGSAAVLLFFIPLYARYLGPVFDRALFRTYFAFGFPIIFAAVGKIFIDMTGRWLLERLNGAEQVGYYSAGYRLAAVANFAITAFNLAWRPFLVRASTEDSPQETFATVMTLSLTVLCSLLLLVSFFADNVVAIEIAGFNLIGREFWPGLAVIPPLMVSYIFYGAYINLSVGCDLTGKTYHYAWTNGVAVVITVVLNLALIPRFGMLGTAWATAFAYFFQASALFAVTRRLYPVSYQWGRLTRLALLTGAAWFAGSLAGGNPWLEALTVAAFMAVLFAAGVLDRRAVSRYLRLPG